MMTRLPHGGLRVCTLAWEPGRIPAGTTCGELATAMDLLQTFARMAGGQCPRESNIDGRDIGALLRGNAALNQNNFLFPIPHPGFPAVYG
jgi:arylsulfatase A-like enzyme